MPVHLLPGISLEDCLIAEVGWSPHGGRVMRTATDFMLRRRPVDSVRPARPDSASERSAKPSIAETGRRTVPGSACCRDALLRHYPPGHEVLLYETSLFPMDDPVIEHLPLSDLPQAPATVASILLVPASIPALD